MNFNINLNTVKNKIRNFYQNKIKIKLKFRNSQNFVFKNCATSREYYYKYLDLYDKYS